MRRVYVASSWRNARHPSVVEALRAAGHDVYDYRNPSHGEWSATDQWWKRPGYAETTFPTIINGEARRLAFDTDMNALRAADAVVLVLDSGKSAHLEAGFAAGAGKLLVVLGEPAHEPELMYAMAQACAVRVEEVVAALEAASMPDADTLRPERDAARYALHELAVQVVQATDLHDDLAAVDATPEMAVALVRELRERAFRAEVARNALRVERDDSATELDALRAAVREYLRVGSMASYRDLAARVGLTVREG